MIDTAADVSVDLGALAAQAEMPKPELKFSWSEDKGIDKWAAAMAKAQGAMKSASKDSANPFYSSKYADLDAVVEAAKKPLSDNELAYVQPFTTTVGRTNKVTVITMIIHSSGQWMKAEADFPVYAIPPKGQPINPATPVGPQAFGSAETYLRRYALQSMLGIPAADDDGNAASGMEAKDAPPPKPSGAEQVRGALARPPTASAKQSEPPKEATKPAPLPPNVDPVVATRFSLLWGKAKEKKYSAKEFDAFRFRVLNAQKPSSHLSSAEMDLLEAAWPAETAK